jgi:hypothetical protein
MPTNERYLVTVDSVTQEVTRIERLGEAGELREQSLEGIQFSGLKRADRDQASASSEIHQRSSTPPPQPPAIIIGGPRPRRHSRKAGPRSLRRNPTRDERAESCSPMEKYLVTLDSATQELTRLERVGEAGELREVSYEGVRISGLPSNKSTWHDGRRPVSPPACIPIHKDVRQVERN